MRRSFLTTRHLVCTLLENDIGAVAKFCLNTPRKWEKRLKSVAYVCVSSYIRFRLVLNHLSRLTLAIASLDGLVVSCVICLGGSLTVLWWMDTTLHACEEQRARRKLGLWPEPSGIGHCLRRAGFLSAVLVIMLVGLAVAWYWGTTARTEVEYEDAERRGKVVIHPDPILLERIESVFDRADALRERKRQRSRDYLAGVSDKQLAQLHFERGKDNENYRFEWALKAVTKDRQRIIKRLKGALPGKEQEAFDLAYDALINELVALGPEAVSTLSTRTGLDDQRSGHYNMAQEALSRMGPEALESLMIVLDSDDDWAVSSAIFALSRLGDARARDALLKAHDSHDGHPLALIGLLELGPEVVGEQRLISCLSKGLHKPNWLGKPIEGLTRHGDETALKALSDIERFWPKRRGGAEDLRYKARLAINAILRRSGKRVQQVSPEDYTRDISYEEFLAALEHPNPAIRCEAARMSPKEGYGLTAEECDRLRHCFIERITVEPHPSVLGQLAWGFSYGPSEAESFPQNMQHILDNLVTVLRTHGARARPRKGHAGTTQAQRLTDAALNSVWNLLAVAKEYEIRLDRTNRLKSVLKSLAHPSYTQDIRIGTYLVMGNLLRMSPDLAPDWSSKDIEELQRQLVSLLEDPASNTGVIQCLGHVGDASHTDLLLELLEHQESYVRSAAALALGDIGDPKALPALTQLARTDSVQHREGIFHVRNAAVAAITKIEAGVK